MGNLKSKFTVPNQINQQEQETQENSLSSSEDSTKTTTETINKNRNFVNEHSVNTEKPFDQNPGTVEDLHKECKDIMPDFTEGAHLTVNKHLNNNFQLSHQIRLMPNATDSLCRFGVTYIGTHNSKVNPSESYPIIFGEMSGNGFLQANIIQKFLNDKLRLRFGAAYLKSSPIGSVFLADYFQDTYTISLGISNPDFITRSGSIVFQYLQKINSNLSLGNEISRHYGFNIPDGSCTIFNTVMRYRTDDNSSIISAKFGSNGINLTYFKEINPQLRLGVELDTNLNLNTTYTAIGYEISLPKSDNFIFRGSIDNNWNVRSVLEKKLSPLPVIFSLSALLNHQTNEFRLGCGIIIDV